MFLSIVQTNPIFGSKKENIDQALSMMRLVKADLYVLPELFSTGYNFIDMNEVRQLAEPFDRGETFNEMLRFASDNQCYVVYGFAEESGNTIYNSAAILGYDGTKGLYRKIHLFDRETLFFEKGDMGFQVFNTPIGRIGLMICFDWYFPEAARTLALKGAQIIAHPSNLVLPNCPDCMPTRCLENRVFAATANRVGNEERGGNSLVFIGQSQITSPQGKIIHRLSADNAEIATEEIDLILADDKNITPRNNLFNDRRPECYW